MPDADYWRRRAEAAELLYAQEQELRVLQARERRLALSVAEACEALGVSWGFFHDHVTPDLKIVRKGRRKLVSVRELERWLEKNGETPL